MNNNNVQKVAFKRVTIGQTFMHAGQKARKIATHLAVMILDSGRGNTANPVKFLNSTKVCLAQ